MRCCRKAQRRHREKMLKRQREIFFYFKVPRFDPSWLETFHCRPRCGSGPVGGGRCDSDPPPPLFRGTEGGRICLPLLLHPPPPPHNGHWCVCVGRRRGRGCCRQPHPRLIGRGHTSLWNPLERGHMTAPLQLGSPEREKLQPPSVLFLSHCLETQENRVKSVAVSR